ncbi:MAG: hypothetical protein WC756_01425 [Taibaiella sp.]|jgi:hypothetical protein
MSHISPTQHRNFCAHVAEKLDQLKASGIWDSEGKHLKDNYETMQDYFDIYQSKMKELRELIQRYEGVKKQTRILLRKKHLKHKADKSVTHFLDFQFKVS